MRSLSKYRGIIFSIMFSIFCLSIFPFQKDSFTKTPPGDTEYVSVHVTGNVFPAFQDTSTVDSLISSQIIEVPPASDKAMRLYNSGIILYIISLILKFSVPWLILYYGFGSKIHKLSETIVKKIRPTGSFYITCGITYVIYTTTIMLIYLPFSYYAGFIRMHEYGLSNQTFIRWLVELLKGHSVSSVLGFLVVPIVYLFMRKYVTRWWLYISMLFIPFLIAVILLKPIVVDPLYNDFGPMQDKELEQRITELASRAGIEGSRIFEVDKSMDTNSVNAYVTGIGDSKRIVLWDTIIAELDDEELLVVMAHEMGHYVLNHIYWGMALGCLGTFVMFFLIYKTAYKLIDKFKSRFGFTELHSPASLPLMILLINFYTFLGQPIANTFSRYIERESDRYSLELTRDNYNGAKAFVKLQRNNLSNPYPGEFYKIFRYTHPPIGERIEFFNTYRPWDSK